ncbi:MAG: class I SAM-dependent methyltransferase [Candidatus Altiarchaeota archaeon]
MTHRGELTGELPEPDWDAVWGRNLGKNLTVFRVYSGLRFRSYRRLFSGLDLEGRGVLEIGGGTGQLGSMLGREFKCNVTLIDDSEEAFRFHSRFGIKGVDYVRGDVFRHEGVYHLVYSDGLIEHYRGAKREDLIRRHSLLCGEGGYTAFFVPKKSFFVDMFLTLRGYYEEKYDVDGITSELEENGLEVLKTVEDFHMIGVLCEQRG